MIAKPSFTIKVCIFRNLNIYPVFRDFSGYFVGRFESWAENHLETLVSLFYNKNLPEEKFTIVEHGESQPLFATRIFVQSLFLYIFCWASFEICLKQVLLLD
jgi:predicted permease